MPDVALMVGGGRGSTGAKGDPGTNAQQYIIYEGQYSGLPAPQQGALAVVTDIGLAGSLWIASATDWKPFHQITLLESNQQQNFTGTALHIAYSYAMPANLLRGASALEVEVFGSCTGSTNSKLIEVGLQLNSGGTNYYAGSITTTNAGDTTFQFKTLIVPKTAATQMGRSWVLGSAGNWVLPAGSQAGTIDTAQAVNAMIKTQCGLGTEFIYIEACKFKLVP